MHYYMYTKVVFYWDTPPFISYLKFIISYVKTTLCWRTRDNLTNIEKDINSKLIHINNWAKLWLVFCNPKKTKALIISKEKKPKRRKNSF